MEIFSFTRSLICQGRNCKTYYSEDYQYVLNSSSENAFDGVDNGFGFMIELDVDAAAY